MARRVLIPGPTIGPIAIAEVHVALHYYAPGSVVGRWSVSKWDQSDSVWASATPPATDVSCQVISVRTNTGRDQPLERFRAGNATVLIDDPAGDWTPWASGSGYASVRPGIGLSVWAVIASTVYPIFAGTVLRIADLWPTPDDHQVQFDAADFLAELAAYDGIEQTPAGDGETSGPRIDRILTNAGYVRDRVLDLGSVELQATTLAKNALDEIGLVCDTETGVAFVDRAGTLIHRDRNGLVSDPLYTTVQATFGEVAPELCYAQIELATDTEKIKNVVSISNEGGSAVTIEDPESKALYGPHTYRRLDLIHVDEAESPIIAQRELDTYALAANRVERLGLAPVANPEILAPVLGLGLLYRIMVKRRDPGFQVAAELQIQGIEHAITGDDWTITLRTFSAASIFKAARWSVTTDVWDTARWAY
jgi:hypothetical protein